MKRMLAIALGACLMWTAAPLYADQIAAKDILRTEDGSVVEGTALATKADLEATETRLNSKIEATETTLRAETKSTETRLRDEIQVLRSEMRWLFGILIGVFLAAAGFFWKMLSDLKAQFAALAERMQIAAPTINPAPDGQGHFDLTAAGNKTEAD